MSWTDAARREDARPSKRHASDLTDREWGLLSPFPPPPRRLGRPRTTDFREVANAILYLVSTGCQWRMPPKDFPPVSTVQRHFHGWRDDGLFARVEPHAGRKRRPTTLVV